MHWLSKWVIPVNPSKCAALNVPVVCNFTLYSNATNLTESEKLVPNDDVTGKTLVRAFIGSASIALILSFLLMWDKFKVHVYDKRRGDKNKAEDNFYIKMVHTVETLLHTVSDQQLVAGIALLLSINRKACEISAYHMNLVCTMLLMGIVTHLNTLINVPDFIYKGKTVATYRILGILTQLILSGIVLSARNASSFPAKPSSLAIMPASCFENMNATNDFGFSDFLNFAQNVTTGTTSNTTSNATQIIHNIDVATSANAGLEEYVSLVVFMVFAVLVLLFDYFEAIDFSKSIVARWVSISFSGISIFASSVIIAVAGIRYHNLRVGMEVDQWYTGADADEWTYSQILPILLLGSGSIAFLKAVTDSLGGIRGRRFEEHFLKSPEFKLLRDQVPNGDDKQTELNKPQFNA